MSANSHNRPSICTVSGVEFFPLDPRPEDVRLTDIAHALAQIPRYTGHAREPYSVAQHSVFVADLISAGGAPDRAVALALLHDAAEAYVGDCAGPLKRTADYRRHRKIESRVADAVMAAFGLDSMEITSLGHSALLAKRADRLALEVERRDLMPRCDWWPVAAGIEWVPEIVPLPWREAREQFLDRARRLGLRDMACSASVQAAN